MSADEAALAEERKRVSSKATIIGLRILRSGEEPPSRAGLLMMAREELGLPEQEGGVILPRGLLGGMSSAIEDPSDPRSTR